MLASNTRTPSLPLPLAEFEYGHHSGYDAVPGAGLIWLAMWAYARRPERAVTIVGVTLLCVVVICALYLEPVLDRIPYQLCVTTGKSAFLPNELRVFLGLLAAAGVALVARDLLPKR